MAATLDDIAQALQKADAAATAGDAGAADEARQLAQAYRDMQAQQQAAAPDTQGQPSAPAGPQRSFVVKNEFADRIGRPSQIETYADRPPSQLANNPLAPASNSWADLGRRAIESLAPTPPDPRTQTAANVELNKGRLEAVPSWLAGMGGDVMATLEGLPGGPPAELAKHRPLMTHGEIADYLFGKATNPMQALGRELVDPWSLEKTMGPLVEKPLSWAGTLGTRALESVVGPFTDAGKQRAAQNYVKAFAADPDKLATVPPGEVPGSNQTSWQAYGDPGLGSLESELRGRTDTNPDFVKRDTQQAADLEAKKTGLVAGAKGDLQKGGDPLAVADRARKLLADIEASNQARSEAAGDRAEEMQAGAETWAGERVAGATQQAQAAAEAARAQARTAAEGLGGVQKTDLYGGDLRTQGVVAGETGSQAAEKAVWDAVDPNKNLVLDVSDVGRAGDEAAQMRTGVAKPLEGEPKRLLDVARSMRGTARFQELRDLEADLNAAISQEKHGPTKAVLGTLKDGVVRAMNRAINQRAAKAPDLFDQNLAEAERILNPSIDIVRRDSEALRAAQASGAERGTEGAGAAVGEGTGAQGGQSARPSMPQGVPGPKVKPRSLIEHIRDIGGVRLIFGTDGRLNKESQDLQRALQDLTPGQRSRVLRPDGKFTAEDLLRQSSIGRYLDPGKEDDLNHLFDKIGQDAGAYPGGKSKLAGRQQSRVYVPEDLPEAGPQSADRRQADVEAVADSLRVKGYDIPPRKPRESPQAYEQRVRAASERDEASRALGSDPNAQQFDAAAAERLAAAKAKTVSHKKVYNQGVVGQILHSSTGYKTDYSTPASQVAGKLFTPGVRGAENVEAFRRSLTEGGMDETEAINQLKDYAAAELKRVAMRPDGTLDPAKVETFIDDKHYGPALRVFPEVRDAFADAAAASRTVDEVEARGAAAVKQAQTEGKAYQRTAAQRAKEVERDAEGQARQARAKFQDEAIAKLLGVHTPEDVTRVIGSVLANPKRETMMGQIAGIANRDPESAAGFRRAVIDHIFGKYIDKTGAPDIKGLQEFLRTSRNAVRPALSNEVLDQLDKFAADFADATKEAPERPTARLPKTETALKGRRNVLRILLQKGAKLTSAGLGVYLGGKFGIGGEVVGAMSAVAAADFLGDMRAAGVNTVMDAVKKAALDPPAMRALMAQIPEGKSVAPAFQRFGKALRVGSRIATPAALGSDIQRATQPQDNQPPRSYADVIGAMRAAPAAN